MGRWIFILFGSCSLFAEVDTWQLSDLDLKEFEVVKEHFLHTIYRSQENFIKIWNENTRNMIDHRNDWFYFFVRKGALDGIAPLKAVIINDKGKCCGYVTFACSLDFEEEPEECFPLGLKRGKDITKDSRFKAIKLIRKKIEKSATASLEFRENSVEAAILALFRRMRVKTERFGVCFNDLGFGNFGFYEGVCYCFDLDGVWNLDDYRKVYPTWQKSLFYLNL